MNRQNNYTNFRPSPCINHLPYETIINVAQAVPEMYPFGANPQACHPPTPPTVNHNLNDFSYRSGFQSRRGSQMKFDNSSPRTSPSHKRNSQQFSPFSSFGLTDSQVDSRNSSAWTLHGRPSNLFPLPSTNQPSFRPHLHPNDSIWTLQPSQSSFSLSPGPSVSSTQTVSNLQDIFCPQLGKKTSILMPWLSDQRSNSLASMGRDQVIIKGSEDNVETESVEGEECTPLIPLELTELMMSSNPIDITIQVEEDTPVAVEQNVDQPEDPSSPEAPCDSKDKPVPESRCPHRKKWKRLRAKRGKAYFVCTECGAKWKVDTAPKMDKNNNSASIETEINEDDEHNPNV